MHLSFRYGAGAHVKLELPDDALVTRCDAPRGTPLANLHEAATQALAAPLGMPPLSHCLAPGDRVALALESGVPAAPVLVAALVDALVASGISPRDVCVVRGAVEQRDPRDGLSAAMQQEVRLVEHDPSMRDRLSLVGFDRDQRMILINRELGDADVVIPIGCLRPWLSTSYLGVLGAVYPTLAKPDAQKQLRTRRRRESARAAFCRSRRASADAARRLGVTFVLQVVPAAGDAWLHVLAGDPAQVERTGRALSREAWTFEAPVRAKAVVATIEGPPALQTWSALGRALRVASGAVEDDGALLVCCEVAEEPGPALKRLAAEEFMIEAIPSIKKNPNWADRVAAFDVVRATARARVYLLSNLDPTIVEDLGMAPVADSREAARFIARHDTVALIGNAHLASPAESKREAGDLRL